MKNVVIKYLSVLLAVWYSLSIIGFDVHSCVRTGDSFVSLIVSGVSCDDIHPEHSCHSHGSCCGGSRKHSCCSSHSETASSASESASFDRNECCTNDFKVLVITGTHQYDEQSHFCHCPVVEYFAVEVYSSVQAYCAVDSNKYIEPDSGHTVPDAQALLNIWRI